MKKVILIICLAFSFSQTASAQVDFGVKGGVNYNSESIKNVSEDILQGAESKTGYHAGVWLRFKLPIIGFYVRPELVYTNLSNEVTFDTGIFSTQVTTYNFQKIDIPVLFGKKIFGVGNIFIGPSFQYVLDSDFSINDISDVEAEGFTLGMQLGAGVELGNIGIDVRWERGFNDAESTFARKTGTDITFDTRVSQIILGVSFKF